MLLPEETQSKEGFFDVPRFSQQVRETMDTLLILPFDLLTPLCGPVRIAFLGQKGTTGGELIGTFPEIEGGLPKTLQPRGLLDIPAKGIGIHPKARIGFQTVATGSSWTCSHKIDVFPIFLTGA